MRNPGYPAPPQGRTPRGARLVAHLPLPCSSFAASGVSTMNSYWSALLHSRASRIRAFQRTHRLRLMGAPHILRSPIFFVVFQPL
jgi:hypothetical protein